MISVTITDRSGRTLSGQTLDAFYISIEHARPWCVGINCALGARDMRPYLAELSRMAGDCWVSAYPNAGLPNAFGEYDETAATRRRGCSATSPTSGFANILGGCCGTTPDHIARDGAGGRRTCTPRRTTSDVYVDRRRRQRNDARRRFSSPPLRSRAARHPSRQQLPDDRRAHQRHRLAEVRAADQGRQLRPKPRPSRSTRCAAAPTSST